MPDELICGLEIHQQLDTKSKLFCRCPVGYRNDRPDARILRHMRPTMSEMGTYDGTALMEFKTRKQVHYEVFYDTTCTYELDDTPPFPMDQDALRRAVVLALQLNCVIVDEIHISRKQYLDGSIPTGFQRTAIIGVNGYVPFEGRRIGIRQVSLEEDACREMEDKGHRIVFRTDRLGTPLVEVVTEPDMRTPEEAGAVARHIGRLMRATGLVRRGMGATRQDVNVSVPGGTRVEIKGVPKLDWIPRLVETEAGRQRALLAIRAELERRGVTPADLPAEGRDLTEALIGTRSEILREAIGRGDRIVGARLPGFAGLMDREVQPGVPFAREFAGRVRVIACLDAPVNLMHTDALPAYGLTKREVREVSKALGLGSGDVGVLVWGPEADATLAAKEVLARGREALEGVPSETRQAFASGITDFERILPGPDRMYPDTDLPPTVVDPAWLESLKKETVEPPWDREARWIGGGVPPHLARRLSLSPLASALDAMIEHGLCGWAAHALAGELTYLRRRGVRVDRVSAAAIGDLLARIAAGEIAKEAFPTLVRALAEDPESSVEDLARSRGLLPVDEAEVAAVVRRALDEAGGVDRGASPKRVMGLAMRELRGRADGGSVWRAVEAVVGGGSSGNVSRAGT